ncbi:hypothetical protein M947_07945 [Sulfurimonas hongkongensis]|uniref:Uncharacterized protein n=1 Tax=Sulfurimonas hongkongensis TaxID=1172190 RepID=T0KPP2_9BACT|nr:hypothetical protein [Sulfurimonas hongkongensis]EQB39084.1 hypothetical protein M947_07945 [Sulfurimonas hongkongensis]
MKEEEIYMKLFQYLRSTFFKCKRENVPVMLLLAKCFAKEELVDFLSSAQLLKFSRS